MEADAVAPRNSVGDDVRAELERLACKLGLGGVGHHQLLADFVDGRLRWVDKRHVRVPASRLAGEIATPACDTSTA